MSMDIQNTTNCWCVCHSIDKAKDKRIAELEKQVEKAREAEDHFWKCASIETKECCCKMYLELREALKEAK